MSPNEPGYLRGKVEALEIQLMRHIDDCMRDRQQTREDREKDQAEQREQHKENQARLVAIEGAINQAIGASRFAKWLWGGVGTVGGGGLVAAAAKWLIPSVFR